MSCERRMLVWWMEPSDDWPLLGGFYGSYSRLGLRLAFPQEHCYSTSSDICLIVNASDFCNNILSL